MKLIIEDDEGRRTIVPFHGDSLTIGRAEDNHVRLEEKNVSRKHGRIVRVDELFVLEDLNSFTGIRVNGEKVRGRRQIKEGDLIQISEYDLQIQAAPDVGLASESSATAPATQEPASGDATPVAAVAPAGAPAPAPPAHQEPTSLAHDAELAREGELTPLSAAQVEAANRPDTVPLAAAAAAASRPPAPSNVAPEDRPAETAHSPAAEAAAPASASAVTESFFIHPSGAGVESGAGATSADSQDQEQARRHAETAVIKRQSLTPPELTANPPVELAPEERARLVGAAGTLRAKEFPLTRSPATLGRAPENDVCLDHPQVSRNHCRLARDNGVWKVVDVESRHGVKVNGEPYASSPLNHGDLLEVGPVTLVFALPGKYVLLPPEKRAPPERVPAPFLPPPAAPPAVTDAMPSSPPSNPAPRPAWRSHPGLSAPTTGELRRQLGQRGPPTTPERPGGLLSTPVVLLLGVAIGVGGVLLYSHFSASGDRQADALQRANAAVLAHRYREALRDYQSAGSDARQESRAIASIESEARAEQQYEQLVQAISRSDFDQARSLLDQLATLPTWYGAKAQEHGAEVKSGYVKLHVERANADHGRDDAACLSEANLALAVNPQSEAARALATSCGKAAASAVVAAPVAAVVPSRASDPEHDAPAEATQGKSGRSPPERVVAQAAPTHAKSPSAPKHAAEAASSKARSAAATPAAAPAAVAPAPDTSSAHATVDNTASDAEARRLLRQGNLEATSGDYKGAISDFNKGVQLKPSGAVLGSLYRGLGATYSRSGDAESGARYYRLYLPYCDNPTEKTFLQKTLDDYDASRAHKK